MRVFSVIVLKKSDVIRNMIIALHTEQSEKIEL